jgi:DNA processing protein
LIVSVTTLIVPILADVLGDAHPLVLWLRGSADLRFACLRSVSIAGARAATGYGQHVAIKMAAALAERGFGVVSGGPYNIDKCAHFVRAVGRLRAWSCLADPG